MSNMKFVANVVAQHSTASTAQPLTAWSVTWAYLSQIVSFLRRNEQEEEREMQGWGSWEMGSGCGCGKF